MISKMINKKIKTKKKHSNKKTKIKHSNKKTKIKHSNKKTKKMKTKRQIHIHNNHSHHHSRHHSNSIISHLLKPNYEKNYSVLPKLKGGKFVDRGGYGCVVTPALHCSSSDITNMDLNKYVSKIIRNPKDDISTELKISNILKKIDPLQKYFITYEKYCYISKIPEDRKDIVSVIYKDDDLEEYDTVENNSNKKTKFDKEFCDVELDLKPINLIMKHGGFNLSTIVKTEHKHKGIKSEIHKMFLANFKEYFKHLIIGIIKMHENRIVNRDIKKNNIMVYWNLGDKENNHLEIKYIDFGLSNFITNDMIKDLSNIHLQGTYMYISPELFISYVIKKYNNRTKEYHIKKIMNEINQNVVKMLTRINEKDMINNLNKIIESLYSKIKYLYDKERLGEAYFGTEAKKFNGYLQKGDVYALGMTIYEILYYYNKMNIRKNDSKLYDLLSNMINLDSDKRYNAVQCLSHPYFKE